MDKGFYFVARTTDGLVILYASTYKATIEDRTEQEFKAQCQGWLFSQYPTVWKCEEISEQQFDMISMVVQSVMPSKEKAFGSGSALTPKT